MKNFALVIAAAVVALAFVLFWDALPDLFDGRARGRGTQLPTADSYMRTTLTRKFDAQGRLSYRLNAVESSYFESRDEVVMTQPRLLAHGGQNATGSQSRNEPWHLKADTGVLHNADRRVELYENVVVWRDGPQGKNELRTEKLVYLPDAERLQTDQAVKLLAPNSTTDAIGLDGDLQQQSYHLLSRVRSVHRPQ